MASAERPEIRPRGIEVDGDEFGVVRAWPFQDEYVSRLLREDIPRRCWFGEGKIWVYDAPDGEPVGFGTLDVCDEYAELTAGQQHPYIPLLAVHPDWQGCGIGSQIVRHLITEAALVGFPPYVMPVLYLDVYEDNLGAIGLYRKMGFVNVTGEPIPDPDENGRGYHVMAMDLVARAMEG